MPSSEDKTPKPSSSKNEPGPSKKVRKIFKKDKKEKVDNAEKTARRSNKDFSLLSSLAAYMFGEGKQKAEPKSEAVSPTSEESKSEQSSLNSVAPVAVESHPTKHHAKKSGKQKATKTKESRTSPSARSSFSHVAEETPDRYGKRHRKHHRSHSSDKNIAEKSSRAYHSDGPKKAKQDNDRFQEDEETDIKKAGKQKATKTKESRTHVAEENLDRHGKRHRNHHKGEDTRQDEEKYHIEYLTGYSNAEQFPTNGTSANVEPRRTEAQGADRRKRPESPEEFQTGQPPIAPKFNESETLPFDEIHEQSSQAQAARTGGNKLSRSEVLRAVILAMDALKNAHKMVSENNADSEDLHDPKEKIYRDEDVSLTAPHPFSVDNEEKIVENAYPRAESEVKSENRLPPAANETDTERDKPYNSVEARPVDGDVHNSLHPIPYVTEVGDITYIPPQKSFKNQSVQTEADISSTRTPKLDQDLLNLRPQIFGQATQPLPTRPTERKCEGEECKQPAPKVLGNDHSSSNSSRSSGDSSFTSVNLLDGDKCPKCRIFELMFSSGNADILNDEEVMKHFHKHMNSHLRKARQDLDNLYKSPHDNDKPPSPKPKYANSKKETGTQSGYEEDKPASAVPQYVYDEKDIATQSGYTEPKPASLDKSIGTSSKPGRDKGGKRGSFRQNKIVELLKEILRSENSSWSEETIKKKNSLHDGHNHPLFSIAEDDNPETYCGHSCYYNKPYTNVNRDFCCKARNQNYCSCPKVKSIPLIFCDEENDSDDTSIHCSEMEFLAENCGFLPKVTRKVSGLESNLKWFVKGMIAGLNGHHNPRETNEMIRELSQNMAHEKTKVENSSGEKQVREKTTEKTSKAEDEPVATHTRDGKSEKTGTNDNMSLLSLIAQNYMGNGSGKKLKAEGETGINADGKLAPDQNLDVTDQEVKELVEEIVDALCEELACHKNPGRMKNGNEKMAQKFCGDTFCSLENPAINESSKQSARHGFEQNKNEASSQGSKEQKGERRNVGQSTCPCFCPYEHATVLTGSSCNITNWCYAQPVRTCHCHCSERQTNNCGNTQGCPWSWGCQGICQASSPVQFPTRQKCRPKCLKREKEKTEQRRQLQSLLNKLTNGCSPGFSCNRTDCSRPPNVNQGHCEPFTYVVPKCNMYWQPYDDVDK